MENIKNKKNIFHGPGTVCGIPYHLSRWQRTKGYKSKCIVFHDASNRQLHDLSLRTNEYNPFKRYFIRIRTLIEVLGNYDLIHFCSTDTFLPLNIDLPILKIFKKKLIMTFCGTDIRIKSIHAKRTQYVHHYHYSKFHTDYFIKLRMYWLNLFINRFFAIRELYSYAECCIPKSKIARTPWINNIGFDISTAKYNKPKENQPNIIKIVHAPSNPKVKGTFFIRKEISKIRKMGFKIEYIELIGVPNKKVQEIISEADIIIDQILLGETGTLCFEGMGLGKPVISYLPDNIKK